MDFQIDFGNPLAPPRSDGPLFAAAAGILLPLGPEECVYRLRADASHHVMTRQVFEALHWCRAFRSLDEHAAQIARSVQGLGGRTDVVRRVLDSLAERGLLQSGSDYLSALSRDPGGESPPLRAIFVRTADQPARLAALLDDLRGNELAHRGGHRYVLLDQSRDAANARANGEALVRFAAGAGVRAEHVDGGRWRSIVDRLQRAQPAARDALQYLLGRDGDGAIRAGAARNLAALLGAGGTCVLLDDRQRLPLRRPAQAGARLELAGSADLPVRFHDNVEAALADGIDMPGDPFALLQMGGPTLGSRLARERGAQPAASALRGLEPAAQGHLAAETRILATALATRGASREAARDWLFLLEGDARQRFWGDRDGYLRQLDAPSVWFGAARPRLLARGLHAPFLLDASGLLPAVLPGGHDVDALWGMLSCALWPRSAVWHSELSIGQLTQPGPRAAGWKAETPGLAALLTDLLSSRIDDIRAEAPAQRLQAVAAVVGDLAAASAARRHEMLSEYLAFCRADLVARLQTAFAAANEPPLYWQADVRELVAVNGRALTGGGAPRLADWPESLVAGQCGDHFARELDAYASALLAWPAVWDHAVAQGARLLDA